MPLYSFYKHVFFITVSFFLFFSSLAQTSAISGVLNAYTSVDSIADSSSIIVADASAFASCDRVVIIQMKGAEIDTNNTSNFGDILNLNSCGNYEFNHIASISGNTISFMSPLQRIYNVAGSVQLIKVPQYANATITAPVSCPSWNGSTGGVVIIECSGTLTFNDSINAKSKGFAFGNVSPTGYNCPGHFDYYYPSTSYFGAEKGEGVSAISLSKRNGMGKLGNGGGGGNNVNAGGGGGGNFGKGGNGGFSWEGCPLQDIGGRGGRALTYNNTLNKIYLGGGGGGGQQNDLQATVGTSGGGIVIIKANTLIGNGNTINAGAENTIAGGCDGAGGGGSGGTVLLDVNNFTGALNINANGGNGAITTCYAQGASGGGGGGCIWSKLSLPVNVSFNVDGGIRGIHGSGSQDGLPGDTLSGLSIVGTPFTPVLSPITVSPDDSICPGISILLNVSPNGAGYSSVWAPSTGLNDFSIFNPTATPISTTTYSVTVIDSSGCKTSDSVKITVYPKPTASYSSSTECSGTATQYTDNSTTASGSINSWSWDFGDASPVDFTSNPSHLYSGAGSYSATLIVQNSFTCADTITKTVNINFNPVANFTFLDVCFKDSVFFTDSSYVNFSASIASYLWAFGDASPTGSSQNSTHLYASSDSFDVTLLVTTNQGCSGAATKTVYIFDPPIADFTVSDVCLTDSAVILNTSLNPSMGTIASWTWNLGDGSPLNSADQNPHHLYTATGDYIITLISRSSNLACADTVTDTITVFPLPVAAFTVSDICLEQTMNFTNLSAITTGDTIFTWSWDFDDGSVLDTLQTPQHTYTNFGDYTITLVTTTANNCKDTATNTAIVHPLPVTLFTTNNSCQGSIAQFTDQSFIPANSTNDWLFSWNWNFGDNSAISNNQHTSHLYNPVGIDTVELKVVSDFGCADSIFKLIVINPNPQVNFTATDTTGCEPLCITLQNTSFVPGGNIADWLWNFGDDTFDSSSQNILHCYYNDTIFSSRLFSPTLTVTSDSGCVNSLTKNNYITVFPDPIALFSISPQTTTITEPSITITNSTTGANAWGWDFGDSQIDSVDNPLSHSYADTGYFLITLITSTSFNCSDTAYQTVTIEPDFMFYVPAAFTPNEDGINDTFIAKCIFANEFELSIFDRWGNLIYKTNSIDNPWNGKVNNKAESVQPDVYVYSITIKDSKKVKHFYKGTVSVVR